MIETLVKHEILIKYEPECVVLAGVTFLVDFGPWKCGEKIEYLLFDFGECTLRQLSHDSVDHKYRIVEEKMRTLRSVKFQVTPI